MRRFILQRNRYVKTPARGSVILESTKVLGLAYSGYWSTFVRATIFRYSRIVGLNPVRTWKNFRAGANWDAARPTVQETESEASPPKTRFTWDSCFVDEIRRTIFACKVL